MLDVLYSVSPCTVPSDRGSVSFNQTMCPRYKAHTKSEECKCVRHWPSEVKT